MILNTDLKESHTINLGQLLVTLFSKYLLSPPCVDKTVLHFLGIDQNQIFHSDL
jgi:hypothetical protein